MELSNQRIAKILRDIAAAYTIKGTGNIFQIRAYENAADSIEHLTTEIKDLWEEGKLKSVPGLGESIQGYLQELFKSGKVRHFEALKKGIPNVVFDLLDVPGVGPKTAEKIAKLGVSGMEELKKKLKSGELITASPKPRTFSAGDVGEARFQDSADMDGEALESLNTRKPRTFSPRKLIKKGFSVKLAQTILSGMQELGQRGNRMLLPYAWAQADRILAYLKKCPDIIDAHPLGSLRRMVATVGDLDFSASSSHPEKIVEHFTKMPGVARVVDKGTNREARGLKATVIMQSGMQADLLVGKPIAYGALLQHFTGSKSHNIKLRELANKRGYSLSEYGVKRTEDGSRKVEGGKLIKTETEEEFYGLLRMDVPPPEIREDTGEIEAALEHKLPVLVELKDIRGDLHTHSNYPIKSPSHAPGVADMEEIVKKAQSLGYEFIGISDHPPGFSTTSQEEKLKWVEKRTKVIQNIKKSLPAGRQGTKNIRVLNGLEIDILPDGSLSVPDEALKTLDYCIAGIHSGHRGSKEIITKRLISALNNPHVDIISHPTNRLLNERDSSDADWEQIFKLAAKNNKILEINGYPNRLDLRDDLVRQALEYGVKFVIDTDAHAVDQMDNMRFGVSVARRGWATKEDVVNTWDWTKFAKWFKI